MFLVWYDNDRKKPVSAKIEEASERFVEKYGQPPAVVLVNPAERIDEIALPVVARPTIGKDHYWLGDQAEAPAAPVSAA